MKKCTFSMHTSSPKLPNISPTFFDGSLLFITLIINKLYRYKITSLFLKIVAKIYCQSIGFRIIVMWNGCGENDHCEEF